MTFKPLTEEDIRWSIAKDPMVMDKVWETMGDKILDMVNNNVRKLADQGYYGPVVINLGFKRSIGWDMKLYIGVGCTVEPLYPEAHDLTLH